MPAVHRSHQESEATQKAGLTPQLDTVQSGVDGTGPTPGTTRKGSDPVNKQALLSTKDTRYSLKTLQAMHYGATYSGVSDRGIVHIEFTVPDGAVYTGTIVSIVPDGVIAHAIDSSPPTCYVTPEHILHAEVV